MGTVLNAAVRYFVEVIVRDSNVGIRSGHKCVQNRSMCWSYVRCIEPRALYCLDTNLYQLFYHHTQIYKHIKGGVSGAWVCKCLCVMGLVLEFIYTGIMALSYHTHTQKQEPQLILGSFGSIVYLNFACKLELFPSKSPTQELHYSDIVLSYSHLVADCLAPGVLPSKLCSTPLCSCLVMLHVWFSFGLFCVYPVPTIMVTIVHVLNF